MKKLVALILAAMMLLASVVAFAEETPTFTIMGIGSNGDPTETKFYQKLNEATGVNIKYMNIGTNQNEAIQKLNLIISTEECGDAIMGGNALNDTYLALYAAEGYLLPLNEYINEDVMPNFVNRVLAESPETLAHITSPDGNIYALPRLTALKGNYQESTLMINKNWLEQLNMEIPTTLEELEAYFEAVRTTDLNGNGEQDEIPLLAINGDGSRHLEAWLGMYGIATKDGSYENYVYIQDGQVLFAPTSEAYKEAIKMFNRWYNNGWLWSEYFTGSMETFNAYYYNTETPTYGLITHKGLEANVTYRDDYVAMLPPVIEGYETSWYINPNVRGVKNQFMVTSQCEDPAALLSWIDQFYTLENTMESYYGIANEEKRLSYDGNTYVINAVSAEEAEALGTNQFYLSFLNNIPGAMMMSDYESGKLEMDPVAISRTEFYKLYEAAGIQNDEIWPRPYFDPDDASYLAELRTDIFNTVKEYRAKWITEENCNIDAEWDAYIKQLKDCGVEDLVKIMQDSYTTYISN